MLLLTEEELKLHEDLTECYICRNKFTQKLTREKNRWKLRDHWHFTGKYRVAADSICNLRFNAWNEISVVSQNGSNCNYHFVMKESANEFKDQFECLGENTGKYKTFSVPIESEIRKIDKDVNEDITTVSHKIKHIDSTRSVASWLSNLVDNLREGNYKIKYKDCNCFLKYGSVNGNLIKYKCFYYNKNDSNSIDGKLKF